MKEFIAVLIGGAVIVAIILFFGSFTIVRTGDIGIVYRLGKITRTLEPGFHFKAPFIDGVTKVDTLSQKEQVPATAASKDLQNVNATVAVEFGVDPQKVTQLYQEIGKDYKSKVIDPAVQEAVKGATAKYTAEELITKRELVREDIKVSLSARLTASYINLKQVSIVNFDFSPGFNNAIEEKVKAEQNALTSKNLLEQKKYEAEQVIVTAEATAKSIRLQSDAANNEKYIALKRLEVELEQAKKWNGVLPVNVYGSAPIPFLNVSK